MKELIFLTIIILAFFKGFGQVIPSTNFKITPSKINKYKIKRVECFSDSSLVKILNFTANGLLKDSIIGYNIEEDDLEFSITDINYSPNKILESYKYTIYFHNNYRCNKFLKRHSKKKKLIEEFTNKKKLDFSVRVFNDSNKTLEVYELNNKVIDTIIPEQYSYEEYILKPLFKINRHGQINTDIDSLIKNLGNKINVTIDTTQRINSEVYKYSFERNDVNNINIETYTIFGKKKKFVSKHSFDNVHLLYMYHLLNNQPMLNNIIQYYNNQGPNTIISQHQFLYVYDKKQDSTILDKIIYDRTNGLFPNTIQLNKDGKLFSNEGSFQNKKGKIDLELLEYYYYPNDLPKKMISFVNGDIMNEYMLVYKFY